MTFKIKITLYEKQIIRNSTNCNKKNEGKMKKSIFIILATFLACDDENSQLFCVTGVNSYGNRVGLGCVYKEKIEEVKGRDSSITDFEVYEVDNCTECPQI